MRFDNNKSIIEQMSWSAINTRFPNSTFDSYQKSWRVKKFFGIEHDNRKLKQLVSDSISKIQSVSLGISTDKSSMAKKTAIAGLAEELGIDVVKSENKQSKSLVMPEAIHLLEPTEASVEIFPKALWCSECKFYGIFDDLSQLSSLNCPNCKTGTLEQRSNLFLCPICGKQEELIPPYKKINEANPSFKCPDDGCNGKLFLDIGNPLSRSKWFCSMDRAEKERLRMICLDCSRFRGVREIVNMQLPFTSASYYKPEKISAVFDEENEEFSPSKAKSEWFLDNASSKIKDRVKKFGISDLQMVKEINGIDIVYGYRTFGDGCKHNFFSTTDNKTGRTVYDAFINQTKGKGLLILLDKETVTNTVLEHLERNARECNDQKELERITKMKHDLTLDVKAVYEMLADENISKVTSRIVSKNLHIPLIRLIHSFEHALTYQAPLSTGLEQTSFQSKIFLKDCAVLIYERDEVEAGGVEFICKNLLLDWLSDSRRHVIDCRYSCNEGCATCLFIQDPLCHPLMPSEVMATYMLPNSILSRELLIDFWGLRNIAPINYKQSGRASEFGDT